MKRLRMTMVLTLVCVMLAIGMTTAFAEVAWTTGNVNIRRNADIGAEVIGTLPPDTEVYVEDFTYTSDGRAWARIDFCGQKGYISDKYLGFDSEYEGEEVYNVSVPMQVSGGDVNVRKWPDIGSDVMFVLENGTNIDVLGFYPTTDGRIWAEIDCNYARGYVSVKYLQNLDFNYALPEIGVHMRVTGGRLNIREEPLITSRDIGTIVNGTELTIGGYYFSSDGRLWAYVESGWDTHGFVSCLYLEKVD